jgi:hypothetical protein
VDGGRCERPCRRKNWGEGVCAWERSEPKPVGFVLRPLSSRLVSSRLVSYHWIAVLTPHPTPPQPTHLVEGAVPAPLEVQDSGELAALHQVLVLKREVAREAHVLCLRETNG